MIRTLAATLATTTCIVALATPAAAQTREYNIPAGSLKSALDAYVRQSGRQVVYRADQVRSARSPGTRGSQSAEAALAAILAGSGFTTRVDGNLVAIVKTGNGQVADDGSSTEETDAGTATDAQQTGEILVTGSRIRDSAPTSPIISISKANIEQTGSITLQDVFKQVPQNLSATSAATLSYSNGPNSGGNTVIDLRGLGPQSTLTLINGRRISAAAGTRGRGVDISSIPASAVSRIDILTDSASAIYGADAVGGVVNIVLEDRYEGFEASVNYGFNSYSADRFAGSALAGVRWNTGRLFAAVQHSESQALSFAQLGYPSSDLRAFGGGNYGVANFGQPGLIRPAAGLTSFRTLTGPGGSPVQTASAPASSNGTSLTLAQLILNPASFSNVQPLQTAVAQEDTSFYITGKQEVLGITFFADALIASRYNFRLGGVPTVTVTVPSTNPFSPFRSETVRVGYQGFTDIGPSRQRAKNDSWLVNVGAEGSFGESSWKWRAVLTDSHDDTDAQLDGQINTTEVTRRAALPDPAEAFNPFGNGLAQSPAVLQAIRLATLYTDGSTGFRSAGMDLNGHLFELPGGSVSVALGAEYREETLSFFQRRGSDPATFVANDKSRDAYALFAEFYAPVLRNSSGPFRELALSAALRYDEYSDFGGTLNPKFGIRWMPLGGVTLRGSWGTSFRAPNLVEAYGAQGTFTGLTFIDPRAPGGARVVDPQTTTGGNPDLRPETATSISVGVTIRPRTIQGLEFQASYFNLDYRDRIIGFGNGADPATLILYEDYVDPGIFTRDAAGNLVAINIGALNAARTKVGAFDVQGSYEFPLRKLGTFTVGASGTFYTQFDEQLVVQAPSSSKRGILGFPPRWKGTANLGWNSDGWSAFLSVTHTPEMLTNRSDARVVLTTIRPQTTADFQLSYKVPASAAPALRGFTFRLGVDNIFKARAPFVDSPTRLGVDAGLHRVDGRTIYVKLTKALGPNQ